MNDNQVAALLGTLSALSTGDLEPNEQQLRNLLSGNQEGPFHFVNLLAFKEFAEYPIEHELSKEQLTGADAYDKYGVVALQQVTKRGGRLMTLNNVQHSLIGTSHHWHRVATMEYQNIEAFTEMIQDPEYRAALVHREAGLLATEVFVTRPVVAEPIG